MTVPGALHSGILTPRGDPYWDKVILLCHCDGVNNGTVFVDEKGHTLTPVNMITSTSSPLYGTASATRQSVAPSYVGCGHDDFIFGTGPFTVECAVSFSTITNIPFITLSGTPGGIPTTGFYLLYDGTWKWKTTSLGGPTPTIGTRYRLAVCRDESYVLRAFIDGAKIYEGTDSTNYTMNGFAFGGHASIGLAGKEDEVRVTKWSRYVADYIPSPDPFPSHYGVSY